MDSGRVGSVAGLIEFANIGHRDALDAIPEIENAPVLENLSETGLRESSMAHVAGRSGWGGGRAHIRRLELATQDTR